MTTATASLGVRLPAHLSPSQVSKIQECPARYLLERAYPPETQNWKVIGTPVHEAIQEAITTGIRYDEAQGYAQTRIDLLLAAGSVKWSKKVPDAEKARDIVRHCIEVWWRQVHPASEDRMPEYNTLRWPPQVELKIRTDTEPQVLMYLDAIFYRKSDDSPVIVDFKTGTSKSSMAQLFFYWWGLRKAGIATDARSPSGWFHNLRGVGELTHFTTYPGDGLIEQWLSEASAIKRNRRYEPRPNMMCPYCPVKLQCPMYGGREAMRNLRQLGEKTVMWVEDEWEVVEGED